MYLLSHFELKYVWRVVVNQFTIYVLEVILYECQGISMEVMKHDITVPLTYNENLVRADAAKKEDNRTTVADRTSRNFIGVYTDVARNGKGRCTQDTGDHNSGHGLMTAAPVEEYVQGCVARSMVQF